MEKHANLIILLLYPLITKEKLVKYGIQKLSKIPPLEQVE